VWFDWTKAERRVGIYYFYIYDREFGPGFIKVCSPPGTAGVSGVTARA
jgi:hypothetical protein